MRNKFYPRVFLLVLVFSLLLGACSTKEKGVITAPDASPDAVPDLVGTYVVNGVDPLGTEYSGHLTIQPGEHENEYILQWIIVGSIQEGRGYLDGNQLHVEWHSIEGMAETRGQTVYTVTQAGELYGPRTVEGYDRQGEEIAFPND